MTERLVTASRESGRRRPRGYAGWKPQPKTRVLLSQVQEILVEYEDYLPLTVRQIFYRLVGAFDYPKDELAYARLSEALVLARRARLIPFAYIRDDGVTVMEERWYRGEQDFLEDFARQAAVYRSDRQEGQAVRLELWSEAAGMMPQLANVAGRYSIPVYSSSGFSSLSAVRQIVDRARLSDFPIVLLHVGDYDPSGESIFEAMTADAIAFLEQDRILASQRISPIRVALTADQVADYDLPTSPPKKTDSRARRWEGETCQLEALAPDKLADVLEDAIVKWTDFDELEQRIAQEDADRSSLLRALPRGASS